MATSDETQLIHRTIELMLSKDESSTDELRKLLEESMIKKFGHAKFLDKIRFKKEEQPETEVSITTTPPRSGSKVAEDSARSSDHELVFSLLMKDELSCVRCHDMDVSAGNQLIECNSCHALYHQDCHDPYITDSELAGVTWMCSSCKSRARKSSKHHSSSSSSSGHRNNGSHSSSSKTGSSSYSKLSVSPSHSSSAITTTASHSNSPIAVAKSPSSSSSSSSTGGNSTISNTINLQTLSTSTTTSANSPQNISAGGSSSTTSQRPVVIPNINIVSANADKRLQNMKRKAAAKIQEKRKPKV